MRDERAREERLYLAASEVVPPLLVVRAPAAPEVDVLCAVVVPVVRDLNAELLPLVALLPVPLPALLRRVVVVVVVLVVAVQAGPGGDGRGLAGELLAVAEVVSADTDHGVVVTPPVMAVGEALVAARLAVLNTEVVVPAAPVLVVILLIRHPHTEALPLPAKLLVLQTGGGLVLLQPVVTLVAVLGRGGRYRHGRGEVSVVLTVVQPVVAVVVVVTHAGCRVVVAGSLYAVLPNDAAVLAVQAVFPLRVPAGFHLKRFGRVVGVKREAESEVVRAIFLVEVSNTEAGVTNNSFVATQSQALSREGRV